MGEFAIARDVMVAVSAAVGAGTALWGVNTWRRQLAGQDEYEAALRALKAAYKLRDAIAIVRNPWMGSEEQGAALQELGESLPDGDDSVRSKKLIAMTYTVRWRGINDAIQDLDVARVEAEALWGQSCSDAFKPLRTCIGRLNWAVNAELSDRTQRSSNLAREIMDTAYGDSSESDVFWGDVQDAIAEIENLVRPRLKRFVR